MLIDKKFIGYALLAVLAIVALYSFYHRGIKVPFRAAVNMSETDRRGGDFWGTFPAHFVEKYNTELRNKTIVKDWSKGVEWDYGPVQHLLTLPLTIFSSIRFAGAIWLVTNYIFLGLTIWLILRMVHDLPPGLKMLMVCLWLAYWPLYPALEENVIEIFELFMIVLSLYLLQKNRDYLSGGILGLAAMAKFLPMVFLVYFLIKGRFRAFAAMAMTVMVIMIGAQFTLGWQNNRMMKNFITELKSEKYGYTYWRSQTIPSAIERLFSKTDYTPDKIYYPQASKTRIARWATKIAVGAIVLGVFVSVWFRRKSGELALEYGIIAVAMFLVSTHGQHYYLIFSLVGYSFALYHLYKKRYVFGGMIFALSYLITGYIMQIREFDKLLIPGSSGINREVFFNFLSFPTYGSMLLLALLLNIYYLNRLK